MVGRSIMAAPRMIAVAASCCVGNRPSDRSSAVNASKPALPRSKMNPRQILPLKTGTMGGIMADPIADPAIASRAGRDGDRRITSHGRSRQ